MYIPSWTDQHISESDDDRYICSWDQCWYSPPAAPAAPTLLLLLLLLLLQAITIPHRCRYQPARQRETAGIRIGIGRGMYTERDAVIGGCGGCSGTEWRWVETGRGKSHVESAAVALGGPLDPSGLWAVMAGDRTLRLLCSRPRPRPRYRRNVRCGNSRLRGNSTRPAFISAEP